ncbi:MAG: hypothetical protein NZ551_04480 [Microscillaceae bacterium]|nr:hypothetical protein [Microscillaceae bacterium]MDW8460448.1 hypothetical protein [Cytophagales bacterium]
MKKIIVSIGLIALNYWLISCRSKEANNKNTLTITIENVFANQPLALQTPYTTLLGEKIRFTRLQYYLSNVKLKKDGIVVWAEPESYHIIQIQPQKSHLYTFQLANISQTDFDAIEFSVGIDSVRNSSGMQTGALDPLYGMFWTWSTGYIFMRVEGFFVPTSPPEKAFVYHLGSNQAYRTIQLKLPRTMPKTNNQITIKADFQRFFGGFAGASTNLTMPTQDNSVSIMAGELIPKIANNYAQMFELKHN